MTTKLELHVSDFALTKRFYQSIGFSVVWETRAEEKKGYLLMELEDNQLAFWCGNQEVYQHSYFKDRWQTLIDNFKGPEQAGGLGVEIILEHPAIDNYYRQIERVVVVAQPLRTKPWGLQDFRFSDPHGYYIRVTEPFESREVRICLD